MSTRNMAYDHAAYTVPLVHSVTTTAGNATVSGRFVAFTDVILKSATVAVVTAGTSATTGNGLTFKTITGQGTATTSIGSVALNTLTAATSTNISLGGVALAQGESLTITNGTDATGVAAVAIEYLVKPGASVTLA